MRSEKIPFPAHIDSTMRKTFVACPTKFYNEFMLHRAYPSIHLVAGAAFARGLEVFRKAFYLEGKSVDDALVDGGRALLEEWGDFNDFEGEVKSPETMFGALEYYASVFNPESDHIQPLRTGNSLAVEFSFAEPIPGTAHPTTGEPIIYTGRFDMIGEYAGGLYIVDEKTTKQLGAQWSKQWNLRSQFTGYCWASQRYGYDVAGAIVRGIAIRKTGFDHAEAITYRPKWLIEMWQQQLVRDVNRMIECWRTDTWDKTLDEACASYGGCLFMDACSSQDSTPWLEAIPYHKWDPLAACGRGDISLHEMLKGTTKA